MSALFASAFLFAAAGAGAQPPVARVAIMVVGSDARAAGNEQRALEHRVARVTDLTIVGSVEFGEQLRGGISALPIDLVGPRREADLLEQATAAFYDAQLDLALARITALESSQDRRVAVSIGERKRAHLWHAVFLLTRGDRVGADAQVRSALVLDPEMQADVRVFPPALREIVDSARAQGFRKITVTLDGLPPGAEVRVDERVEQPRFSVPSGRHWIDISARGFRAIETSFDSNEDVTIAVPLALSFAESAALSDWIYGADAAPLPPALKAAADAATLDSLIGVSERSGRVRARMWSRLGTGARSTPEMANASGGEKLLAWAQARAALEASAAVDARVAALRSTWRFTTAGSFAVASDERRVSGGASFASSFSGAGPSVAAGASFRGLCAELNASVLSFDISSQQVTLPDGSTRLVTGGTRTSLSLAAGWQHVFGPGEAEYWPALRVLAGVTHEDHRARSLRDSRGDLGLYPSQTRDSADLRVALGAPVAWLRRGPLRVEGELGVRPFSQWRESPSGATGKSPRASPSTNAALRVSWQPRGPLRFAAEGSWERSEVHFSGDGFAPLSPVLRNAKVTETSVGAALSLSRSF